MSSKKHDLQFQIATIIMIFESAFAFMSGFLQDGSVSQTECLDDLI